MTVTASKPAAVMTVPDLCAALLAGGFALSAESRTTLSVRPRAGITEAMATAIQHYKARLIEGLYSGVSRRHGGTDVLADPRDPITPHPCRYCGAEFVSAPDQDCKWCQAVIGKPLRMTPKSPEERAFLAAWERRTSTEKTVPTIPTAVVRADRDSSSKTLPAYATTT